MQRRRLVGLLRVGGVAALVLGAGVVLVRGTRTEIARYAPGESVEGITSTLTRKATADTPPLALNEVAAEAGIDFHHFSGPRTTQLSEDMGSGLAFGDVDADGDDDLLVQDLQPEGAPPGRARLFLNSGAGGFQDATEAWGLVGPRIGMAATLADYDGDGRLDALLTGYDEVRLLHNEGGRFADVTAASGLVQPGFWSGAAWADFDGDGDLDVYVGQYVRYRPPSAAEAGKTARQYGTLVPASLNPSAYEPGRKALYRNDGGGRFVDVAAEAGVVNPGGRTLQVVFSDFDADGDPDLYLANDVSDNALYRNRGDGTFEDVSHGAWVADYRGAMGLAVADVDGDAALDLFITHWLAQENALYHNLTGAAPAAAAPLRFVDQADGLGLGQVALDYVGWGAAFLDLDRDGRLDLFVANGSTLQDERDSSRLVAMRSLLFWNGGAQAGFREAGDRAGPFLMRPVEGRGVAVSDYDGDGDEDVAVLCRQGPLALLRNDTPNTHHWLEVRLRGAPPNVFAVGARLTLETSAGPRVREVQAGSSYLSQNTLTQHFGLGAESRATALSVRWPDGRAERFAVPGLDRRLTLTEGEGSPEAPPGAPGSAPRADPQETARFFADLSAARTAYTAGRFPAALAGLDAALHRRPTHAAALKLRGIVLAELARFAEARTTWERLSQVAPAPDVEFNLGAVSACVEPGAPYAPDEAARHFDAVLRVNPEQTGPATRLAELSLLQGRTDEAAARLRAVVSTNTADVAARFLLGLIAYEAGDLATAGRELAAAAEAARHPIRAVPGAAGEGETRNVLSARLMDCRPFARFQADLAKAVPEGVPPPALVEARYRAAADWARAFRAGR